jgi:hypothetical protein
MFDIGESKKAIDTMNRAAALLYTLTVPHYFSYEQYCYLLAITPLSLRERTVEKYMLLVKHDGIIEKLAESINR